MTKHDVQFHHHADKSSQANPELDLVIQFESWVWFRNDQFEGYVGGLNKNRGETENGLIRVALGAFDIQGRYYEFTDEQIASTIAHELVHSAGLTDVNLRQGRPEDKKINESVPNRSPNLMKQKISELQGPFLTPQQQDKVSRTADENKTTRELKQEQRKDRNNE